MRGTTSKGKIIRVGVDLGGTWIRVQAADARGRIVRTLKAPAPSKEELSSFLKRHFHRWKATPMSLCIASRGIWTSEERKQWAKKLKNLAGHVDVLSDVEAAWWGAFRESREGGILIISGTGSIAFGRHPKGRTTRAGGLGPLVGDEGSAFWIGKEWLKRTARPHRLETLLRLLHRTHAPVRHIAALTPSILQRAQKGHSLALNILWEAQDHLARLVVDVAKHLRWKGPLPVSWTGSVLENKWFREGFFRTLRRQAYAWGLRIKPVVPREAPVTAITLLSPSPLVGEGGDGG